MKNAFWLFVGSFLIAVGASTSTLLPMLAGLAAASLAWCEHKRGVLRMFKDGRTIIDNSDGAWTLIAFDGVVWLAHMGDEWMTRYGHTWAFGRGRERVWFFTPKGMEHE